MTGQPKFDVSGDQIAAARRLIRMTQAELSEASGISDRTIAAFESGTTVPHESTIDSLRQALERRGIVFTHGDTPGIIFIRRLAENPTQSS